MEDFRRGPLPEGGLPTARARVLVVDDDSNICAALRRILQADYNVRVAESGEEALTIIDEWTPDLVLADVLMPGIGGHGLLAKIRSHDVVADVPVIMLSGAVDEAVIGLDTGANDYVTKPFVPAHLMARVRSALRLATVVERFQRLLDTVPVGVFRMDLDETIVEANRPLTDMLYYPDRSHLVGRTITTIADRDDITGLKDRIGDGSARAETECKIVRNDESLLWSCIRLEPVRDRRGVIIAYDGLVEDISARVESSASLERARDDLLRAEKMASIGELASGVAHEINTPVQYIGDNIRFIADACESLQEVSGAATELAASARGVMDDATLDGFDGVVADADVEFLIEEIPESTRQALEGVAKVAEIVQALKSFAHPGGDEKAPVDLAQTIRDVSVVARNEYKYVADLQLDLDPELGEVVGLSGKLSQAILNILVNAAHAVGEVVAENPGQRGRISIVAGGDDDQVEIQISDTGPGIPEEIRERIFERFFTTKKVGKGSGQGLAIALTVIVELHSGKLDVESTPGEGTTFIIRLPRYCPDQRAG